MYQAVLQHVPSNWDTSRDKVQLSKFTEEFKQVQYELRQACGQEPNIFTVDRVQDVFSFGQFILREQLLAVNSNRQLYRVRRYVEVDKNYVKEAIKYNLDPRRCNLGTLIFKKRLTSWNCNKATFIVQVLTYDPDHDHIQPNNSLEYYIEYVVEY